MDIHHKICYVLCLGGLLFDSGGKGLQNSKGAGRKTDETNDGQWCNCCTGLGARNVCPCKWYVCYN